MTKGGLPPWKKAVISMPKYAIAMGKTPSELRRWQNASHSPFAPVATSPFTTEKRNAVYAGFGRKSTPVIQFMQRMTALSSLSTPSVAACGATTVWANGPIAPPYLRFDKHTLPICILDMVGMKIGMLLDSIIKPKGEENVEQTST